MGTKRVRYTGERTGNDRISVYPYGAIEVGDVIEVSDEEAESWATKHVTGIPGTAADLEEAWTLDQLRVIARDHGLDESGHKKELAERIHEADPQIAPRLEVADFEITTDEPTVAEFGDAQGSVPEQPAGDAGTDASSGESEGVSDVG
jgi:hypothetical protein